MSGDMHSCAMAVNNKPNLACCVCHKLIPVGSTMFIYHKSDSIQPSKIVESLSMHSGECSKAFTETYDRNRKKAKLETIQNK